MQCRLEDTNFACDSLANVAMRREDASELITYIRTSNRMRQSYPYNHTDPDTFYGYLDRLKRGRNISLDFSLFILVGFVISQFVQFFFSCVKVCRISSGRPMSVQRFK